ncbi:hypothetical protein [Caulobacter vibrioides]|uniref:Uncharacterized protein n=2 Tax=Caulobacter vibrioides TaxID=155892 RepID=Q9AA28_CAUVC|nr:hypothetical protein [Caulobacter vibrioides]YP_002516194.1 hypothetical protein CCNA_00821 [Caulobacter vibrioides NA1000]AAK22765.1 hypothetical protein CC_0780 [Caulobacter vibrioides CB15]ACL94286.1 hypothetical protein CCNA_00821 [Caulobacter vibrioides NA1000]ATC27622.1 hypothetical protein CA607_04160 [Caulobacter vibrioides]QXZ52859.1 hypothetical protein KZH45_04065 [Caulobacter vibrioides]
MTFGALYQWANLVALLLSTGVALWRGRWPERAAATAMILAWSASAVLHNADQLRGPQGLIMAVDLALFLVLLGIALKSDRWWPMWACAFHALSIVLALAMLADPRVWSRSGFIASGVFSYLTMLSLFLGALGQKPGGKPPAPDAASRLT